jgi:UDP-2,4-diacetamido-2,4,6-trideoxy-beta-L-altropyranose hydrolase
MSTDGAPRPVTLRRATADDAHRVWEWRNEPATRAASFNTAEVSWEGHQRWFTGRLSDSATRMLIASDAAGREIGFVRFDVAGREAEISVALDVTTRGRGWGRAIIRASSADILRRGDVDRVIARIKTDNPRSLAGFTAAGFSVNSRGGHGDADAWTLLFAIGPEADA